MMTQKDDAQGVSRIAVGSLGGTITMTANAGGGVTPTLSAEDLLTAIPALAGLADDISAETLSSLPGASLSLGDVIDVVAWAREQIDRGARGVVIAQGTDTLEETSYLASLFWDRPEPLVFTGAMRPADAPSSDGAGNVLAASRVAMSDRTRDVGVVVVMDDTVHAADVVFKSHTFSTSTMRSRDARVVGYIVEGRVLVAQARRLAAAPPVAAAALDSVSVPMLTTYLGDRGEQLEAVLASAPQGIVIAGFGVGHVSADLGRKLEKAAVEIPVVYASRVPEGHTGESTYGFTGSEMFLRAAGLIGSGVLSALKARLLLIALLAGGAPRDEIVQEFEIRRDGQASGCETTPRGERNVRTVD